jgi:hypothetical protein
MDGRWRTPAGFITNRRHYVRPVWSRDVSGDIAGEVLERAFDADDNLGEDTKRFIDRHIAPGEKRPPAPSVRRDTGADHALRMGARKTGM